jgi:TolB-like protein/Tfp pilus assembly protein PilF/tRNA A-37 threonylcarbamoyl transferase component Bud32
MRATRDTASGRAADYYFRNDYLSIVTDLRVTLESSLGSTYRIDRELGGGGMSRVFLAEELALGRQVVIKVLPEELTGAVSSERFRREMQLAAKLQHPHIVPVLSSGEVEGIPYYTMPFIEGESLRHRIRRDGELPVDLATRIAKQVASAMSYAHRHGIVHRDIKPDNVILSEEFAVVTDFGVAKALSASAVPEDESNASFGSLTSKGMAIGTPAYMAPEQALGEPTVDHRADIYALGVMTYETLCGLPPFIGKSAQALIAAHAIETPVSIESRRPGIPPALAALIMRCLQKRPADRPQTAAEFLQALDATATLGTSGFTPAQLPARRRRSPLLLGAIGLIAVAGIAYAVLSGKLTRGAAGHGPASVAVLPLVNVGGNSRDEYFSEGMTDELANALGKVPGLRVASRTSAYAFKGRRDLTASQIGRQLNVDAVIEGTVRREGERLRVGAQLTSVSDGLALWSDSYERETRDVFQVQDDIARAIASALQVRLGAKPANAVATPQGTDDLTAYDLYLRGRYFWYRRGADNLRRSITYLEQAVARDPQFARAWSALAMSYTLLPEYTDSPPRDAVAKARSASARAISLDSTLAEAHTALGLTAVHAWEFETAGTEYRKALALEPRNPTANQWYGELDYHIGKIDSAIARIREAKALDPLAPIVSAALGYGLILGRRYSEAIAELKQGIELAPTLGIHRALIAHAYLLAGDNVNAVREIEAATRLDPELLSRKGELAYIYGKVGRTEDATRLTADLEKGQGTATISPVALVYAYLGTREWDKAFAELERAVDIHDLSLGTNFSLLVDPIFDPIRNTPRFQHILERTNLARYEGNR